MSVLTTTKRITVPAIRQRKGQDKIVCLTAHSKPISQMMDPFIDLIIVGDSVGMVAYGMKNTLSVTLDMMIEHGKAVIQGTQRSCVVIDMPFGTYQESPEQAYRNAARILSETGCQAVKIEGTHEMLETVSFLVKRGIPVMPHIGLMPQHFNVMGGFKIQGKSPKEKIF